MNLLKTLIDQNIIELSESSLLKYLYLNDFDSFKNEFLNNKHINPNFANEPIPIHIKRFEYTSLQWATYNFKSNYIEFLLKNNANPNFYYNGVTSVGIAAYSHKYNLLKLFKKYNADLKLILLQEHFSSINHPDIGSTLLHRVAAKSALNEKDLNNKIKTCLYLADVYETEYNDANPKTKYGVDVLSVAIEPVKLALYHRKAKIEANLLNTNLPQSIKNISKSI